MCRKLIYLVCFVLLAGPRLYGSPQLDTISYDDGNPLRMDINQNALFAVRFTPVQPFNLMAIDLMVRNDTGSGDSCSLWVADDVGAKPVWPATYVGQIQGPLPDKTWIRFNLAGPMYFENDFHIIAKQSAGPYPGTGFYIGLDYGTTTNRTLKSYSNGQSWQTESQGDATIRAVGMYGTVAPTSPYPADGATLVPTDAGLAWTPWPGAVWQDVYIGTDPEAVQTADQSSPEYVGRLPGDASTYDPGPLELCTGYYWRIDTIPCPECPVTPGPVWDMKTTCESPAPIGDINYDCIVDFKDLAILAENWLAESPGPWCGRPQKKCRYKLVYIGCREGVETCSCPSLTVGAKCADRACTDSVDCDEKIVWYYVGYPYGDCKAEWVLIDCAETMIDRQCRGCTK